MLQNHHPILRWILIILFSSISLLNAQSSELKIIQVSDSTQITPELIKFDSLWYKCMSGYGKENVSNYFAKPVRHIQRPLVAFNFIHGLDGYLHLLSYKLVKSTDISSSLILYQLDLGWMHYTVVYNKELGKIGQLSDFNFFNHFTTKYKNITVHSMQAFTDTVQIQNAYNKTIHAIKDIGVDTSFFINKQIDVFYDQTIIGSERLIGALYPTKYFAPNSSFGGMGDPYTQTVLSGVSNKIHTHELIHLANPINESLFGFISEGIATYYGGTGISDYNEHLLEIIDILKIQKINSFDLLFKTAVQGRFEDLRGNYILAAHLLHQIKSQFGVRTYQRFISASKNQDEMMRMLKQLYNTEDQVIFDRIYLNQK
jgi:hypothetical protein